MWILSKPAPWCTVFGRANTFYGLLISAEVMCLPFYKSQLMQFDILNRAHSVVNANIKFSAIRFPAVVAAIN